MNEVLFFIQILLIVGFAIGALKLGKSALIAWVAIQALVANLFVLKQITLFGFSVTASDAFAIGSLLGLSFLQEYFSREDAKKATWVCFFFMGFFALVSQLHLLYEPSLHDNTQEAFVTILSQSPRLLVASISVFFIVQRVDIVLFDFLKKIIPQGGFALRIAITLVVSQLLDTILFSFVGLYGIVNSMADIILVSFFIKLIVISFSTSAIRWAKG
ncbi:MAG: queuosine precursor transporter [Parachlamydiaceae bacterium]